MLKIFSLPFKDLPRITPFSKVNSNYLTNLNNSVHKKNIQLKDFKNWVSLENKKKKLKKKSQLMIFDQLYQKSPCLKWLIAQSMSLLETNSGSSKNRQKFWDWKKKRKRKWKNKMVLSLQKSLLIKAKIKWIFLDLQNKGSQVIFSGFQWPNKKVNLSTKRNPHQKKKLKNPILTWRKKHMMKLSKSCTKKSSWWTSENSNKNV